MSIGSLISEKLANDSKKGTMTIVSPTMAPAASTTKASFVQASKPERYNQVLNEKVSFDFDKVALPVSVEPFAKDSVNNDI